MEESDEGLSTELPRQKKACHICGTRIVNLNRHLREVHDVSVPKSREYLIVSERGYIKRICPLCSRSIERMRDHLARTHGVTGHGSLNYMVKQAQPVLKSVRQGRSERGRIDTRHMVSI